MRERASGSVILVILSVLGGACSGGAAPEAAREEQAGPAVAEVRAARVAEKGELRVVSQVDLERYMGRWYEIARYPNSFQKGLVGVMAEYRLRDDGRIDVINTGRRERLDGPVKRSTAIGWVACAETNAKLYVRFIWPFKADYWIIDLCDEYRYAVVGQPSRKHLWVLSRTPELDDSTYAQIKSRLKRQGYDPARLVRTPQPPAGD